MRPRLFAAAAALLAACSGRPSSSTSGPPPDGKALFSETCARCHGESLHGDTEAGRAVGAKDLTTPEAKKLSDAELAHQIVAGRGRMPAFGSLYSDEQVRAIVEEVRRRQGATR